MQTIYRDKPGQQITTSPGGSTSKSMRAGFENAYGVLPLPKGNRKTPLYWRYQAVKVNFLNGIQRRPLAQTTIQGVLDSAAFNIEPEIQAAILRARQKCTESLFDSLSGNTDLLSSTAEFAKQGVGRTIDKYVNFLIGWKRKIRKFEFQDISRAWLTAQYELKPLAQDVFAVVQAASGSMTRSGIKITCKGFHSTGFNKKRVTAVGYGYDCPVNGELQVHCKGKFTFIVNPPFDTVAQLTSLDPSRVAWELTPWSFAIDWVYNVGGYLAAMEAYARYSSASKGGYITTRVRANANIAHYASNSVVQTHMNASVDWKSAERIVYSGLPRPQAPSLNLDFGSGTLLNAAALLHLRLGRH